MLDSDLGRYIFYNGRPSVIIVHGNYYKPSENIMCNMNNN